MTSSPRARAVAGSAAVLLLVALAVSLSLVAADLLQWDRTIDRADAAYSSGKVRAASWSADTVLPDAASESLLGLDDDVDYRHALQRFWASNPRAPIRRFGDVTERSGAEREIARVVDAEADPQRRAQLLVLRGALLLEEARNSPVQREVFARRAIDHLKRAATLDPSNADALYDLELALKLLRRAGGAQGSGGDARSPNPDSGSGAATSGGGF
jgi:hypothetical protein